MLFLGDPLSESFMFLVLRFQITLFYVIIHGHGQGSTSTFFLFFAFREGRWSRIGLRFYEGRGFQAAFRSFFPLFFLLLVTERGML